MILLDTNVLVYSIMGAAPQHRDSREVVLRAVNGDLQAVLVPQVVLEAYSTVTSARRVSQPLSCQQACGWLKVLRTALSVKEVPIEALAEFEALATAHPRLGADAFDLFLVAQMRCHRIEEICTYNVGDFAVPGIKAVEPLALI